MLWTLIYEFYIVHIFGGHINGQTYVASIGDYFDNSGVASSGNTNYFKAFTFNSVTGYNFSLSLGNYLSLIATIITMVVIVILCALFVYKIIKLIGGLIR